MKKTIEIRSHLGHEVMALNFAKALGLPVVIIPAKENKEEFEAEAQKIYDNMSFFYDDLHIVSFEEREQAEAEAWDIIADLKAGTLDARLWNVFAASVLTPSKGARKDLPSYPVLEDALMSTLFIPQKLVSDGQCGVTAAQQSLPLEVFDFLKYGPDQLVLGQHFDKVNDLEAVKELAYDFDAYVPGMFENPEVLGIRGVQHKLYYNMYFELHASIGIAGTHTWILLTLFPDTPQIILFNKNGVEKWKDIEAAYQKQGYPIHCIGFDENTDMVALSKEVKEIYENRWDIPEL